MLLENIDTTNGTGLMSLFRVQASIGQTVIYQTPITHQRAAIYTLLETTVDSTTTTVILVIHLYVNGERQNGVICETPMVIRT